MKVALIGHYKDGTGYGNAAQNLILALDRVGIPVKPIHYKLSNTQNEVHSRVKELEEKESFDNIDIVIQCTLPPYFCKTKICSVGCFFYEASHFKGSNWQYACNLMDGILVLTPDNLKACKNSGVQSPLYHIDYPIIDIENIEQYRVLDFSQEILNSYKFYTISDMSFRKGLSALITSYYLAFNSSDNVSLIVKTFKDGCSEKETVKYFEGLIKELKSNIRFGKHHKFPKVILVSERLNDEKIQRLHKTGDCFVIASKGEAICIPAVDAALHQNSVIAPASNGTKKIFQDTEHSLVSVNSKPVVGTKDCFPHLYNFDERWEEPNILRLSESMKWIYEAEKEHIQNSNIRSKEILLSKYGAERAGNKMKELLKAILNEYN